MLDVQNGIDNIIRCRIVLVMGRRRCVSFGSLFLMPCSVFVTRYVAVGSERFSSLCLFEMADR